MSENKNGVNYGQVAKEQAYEGEFRMRIFKSRSARTPDQLYLRPLYDDIGNTIKKHFGLDPDYKINTYPVSCWLGAPGKDYRVALRLNKRGDTFAAFPLDYQHLRSEWVDDEDFAYRNDFPIVFRKKEGALWGAIHPRTGQTILAFTHDRDGEELWKVKSEDGKTSKEYAPGSLMISRSVVSTVLSAIEPENFVRVKRSTMIMRQDEEKKPAEWAIYTYEALVHLGSHFVPMTNLVGNIVELDEAGEKDIVSGLISFRRKVIRLFYPDEAEQKRVEQLSGEEKQQYDKIVALASVHYNEIIEALNWAEKWLHGRFDYERMRRSVDDGLYQARNIKPPSGKLNPPGFPEGYKLPKEIKEGLPLAFRDVSEVLGILFPVMEKRKRTENRTAAGVTKAAKPAANKSDRRRKEKEKPPVELLAEGAPRGELKIGDIVNGNPELLQKLTAIAANHTDEPESEPASKRVDFLPITDQMKEIIRSAKPGDKLELVFTNKTFKGDLKGRLYFILGMVPPMGNAIQMSDGALIVMKAVADSGHWEGYHNYPIEVLEGFDPEYFIKRTIERQLLVGIKRIEPESAPITKKMTPGQNVPCVCGKTHKRGKNFVGEKFETCPKGNIQKLPDE